MGWSPEETRRVLAGCCRELEADWCGLVPFHALEHHLPDSLYCRDEPAAAVADRLLRLIRSSAAQLSPAVADQLAEHGALAGGLDDLLAPDARPDPQAAAGLRGGSIALALLHDGDCARGAIAALRPPQQPPFAAGELRGLLAAARTSLLADDVLPPPSTRTSAHEAALVGVLEACLPVCGAVLGEDGRLLWISETAADWLGLTAARLHTTLLTAGDRRPLERLRRAAARTAADAGDQPVPLVWPGLARKGRRASVYCPRRESWGENLTLVLVSPADEPAVQPAPHIDLEQYGCTRRETEVAALAAGGLTIAAIAEQLGISYHTAHHHMKQLYRKLGVCNRAGLACLLLGQGDAAP